MSKRLSAAFLALVLAAGLVGCSGDGAAQIEPIDAAIQLGGSAATGTPSPSATASASGEASASPTSSASPSASSTEDGDTSEDGDTTVANAVYDKDAELEIEDQSGNGKSVVIAELEVSIDNLWLVISTKSGTVLASMMTTTQSKPVTISLQRAVTTSQELIARLYLDDDDGVFEPYQDAPVCEEPGDPIDEDFEYDLN